MMSTSFLCRIVERSVFVRVNREKMARAKRKVKQNFLCEKTLEKGGWSSSSKKRKTSKKTSLFLSVGKKERF